MQLRHIIIDSPDAGSHISAESLLKAQGSSYGDCEEILSDVSDLVYAAATLFRGLCPRYTPYFIWGELDPLPWSTQYFKDDGEALKPIAISAQVESIADELRSQAESTGEIDFPQMVPAVTFHMPSYIDSNQRQVQGLIVEAMIAFDEFIDALIHERAFMAMRWLSGGYKFFMEAVHQAWPIADRSAKASQRANLGHAENRAMKQEVFVWLDQNMKLFKSMDAAASAVAGKVAPIKWRTARDWVGEWKKVRSAGTA